jgi:colanic acid/amylovoran biosynthesis protein
MKVAVVNGWHDDNKGDGGIVEATIALVLELDPEAEVSIVSTFSADDPAYANAYRHLKSRYPAVKVVPSPLPVHRKRGPLGYYGGVLPWLIRMIPELARLVVPSLGNSAGAQAIADADLVISKGGQVFYNKTAHPRDLAHLLRHLYPLVIARRNAVPYVVFGQSFGPFKGRLGPVVARIVLNGAKGLFVREQISARVLREIGVHPDKIAAVPDAAFWLRAQPSDRLDAILGSAGLVAKKFWVVTVRTWPTGTSSKEKIQLLNYLKEMRALISGILDSDPTSRVALVAHVLGPIEIEDDRRPTAQLLSMLSEFKDEVVFIDADLTPSELVALYGRAKFVVGTRFHSVVFALAGGTPAMAISYFGPKATGIMAQLGMSELCVDIEHFSAVDALTSLLDSNERKDLTQIVEGYRIQLRAAIEKVLE